MYTVTTQLPDEMANELNQIAESEGRSKSWVIREAIADYLVKQDEIHKMTLEGLADIEAGRVIPHEEIVKKFQQWKNKE